MLARLENLLSDLNPFSTLYNACEDYEKLNKNNKRKIKIITIFATIFSLPLLGIAGLGTFIYLTKKFTVLKLNLNQELAAQKIQKAVRSFLQRQRAKRELPKNLVNIVVNKYIIPDLHTNLPRAAHGQTRVYLPPDLPVVIKLSGEGSNQRLSTMNKVRKILEKNRYKHLTVPKVSIYNDMLIEQRLPIETEDKFQFGIYSEHRLQFTEAVREFSGLVLQYQFTDYADSNCLSSYVAECATPRCDNIPFYIDGQHRIGLIDLEHFNPDKPCEDKSNAVRILIRLFPYHMNDILEVAQQYIPNISDMKEGHTQINREALEGIARNYHNHIKFMCQNGISLRNPTYLIRPDETSLKEIYANMTESLLKWYSGRKEEHKKTNIIFFEEKQLENTLQQLQHGVYPKILEIFFVEVEKQIDKKIKSFNTKELSLHHLAAARCVDFSIDNDEVANILSINEAEPLGEFYRYLCGRALILGMINGLKTTGTVNLTYKHPSLTGINIYL